MSERRANFEVLPGLPPYGPLPVAFPASGRSSHSEGFVVRFFEAAGESWVGNFQSDWTQLSTVLEHPNGRDFIVIARGTGFIVDPEARRGSEPFGTGYTSACTNSETVFLASDTDIDAIDQCGKKWSTRRVSWDGIHDMRLSADGATILGQAEHWNGEMIAFKVDVRTGEANGGSYDGPT